QTTRWHTSAIGPTGLRYASYLNFLLTRQDDGYKFFSNCVGKDCYTPSWRLAYRYIDSGVGHGKDASPYLEAIIKVFACSRLWLMTARLIMELPSSTSIQ